MKIHSLDLAKETFDEVLQPEYDEGYMPLELGALGQWLCVLCNYAKSHADLWVMKVYGMQDSWTKLVSIRCLTDDPLIYQHFTFFRPLWMSNDGKLILRFGYYFVLYDSKNISFTIVKDFIDYEGSLPCSFIESLVPPYVPGIRNRLRSSRSSS